jgi:hypothetical protein
MRKRKQAPDSSPPATAEGSSVVIAGPVVDARVIIRAHLPIGPLVDLCCSYLEFLDISLLLPNGGFPSHLLTLDVNLAPYPFVEELPNVIDRLVTQALTATVGIVWYTPLSSTVRAPW